MMSPERQRVRMVQIPQHFVIIHYSIRQVSLRDLPSNFHSTRVYISLVIERERATVPQHGAVGASCIRPRDVEHSIVRVEDHSSWNDHRVGVDHNFLVRTSAQRGRVGLNGGLDVSTHVEGVHRCEVSSVVYRIFIPVETYFVRTVHSIH